ncbi:MAG: efflux RND transporter permease subunit [Bacteroidetes bacterium]|nr:efflux RND transporter permease subunit [Bacteroidota bacterium]
MKFFHSHKSPLTVVIIIILLTGGFVYSRMQVSLFPEITFPKIKIIADAGQMPIDKMILTVTRPIELAIKRVPELKLLRSTTSRGSCELSAFMDWNSNIDLDQQRIESKINEIKNQLPPDVNLQVERMNPSILPVSGYTLESNSRSPIEMKILAQYTVKPFLSQVDGVSEVRVIGGKSKEYHLLLNIQKLTSLGITPEVISTAISNTGFIKSNGYLSDYRMMYLSITDAALENKSELENLVISNNGKRIILLKDIAEVQISEAKEYIRINANGNDGILIAIIKQPNVNLIQLSNDMEIKVAELQHTLPKDVTIKPYYVQADFVTESIRSVTDSLWIGLLLAIIVAVIFLRSWKASVAILLTIPVTLLLTIIIFYATGQTFNIMTLGAIAASIGLIIDDAIVVVEQIHRTHEEHPEVQSKDLVGKAIRYLFPAMIGSSLSTIVIFLPFIFMTGVAGAYFKVMTNSMIITLICSFLVTWLLLPVIYLLLIKKDSVIVKETQVKIGKQQRWVEYFIKKPWISFLIILSFILSIVLVIPKLETGFLPDMDEGSIVLDYSSPPGTSLEETDHILREVEKIIVAESDVATYSRRTGTQMGFFITEPNRGDYLIQLKKNRKHTTEDVIQDIRSKVEASQPSLRIDFGQVIGDILGDLMASVQPVEIKIFGNNRKKLQELSKQTVSIIQNVKGTADVFDGIVIAGPSINVEPKDIQLAQFGITPANLQKQIQTSLEGTVVGTVNEINQLTDIRMTYSGNHKLSVEDLKNQRVFLPNGKLKPISSLASITINSGDAEVNRENLESMGVVTARLDNRDLGSVMNDIQKEVSKLILPVGYHVVYGGAFAEQQQSFKELLMILITSSLFVFAVILFLFREIKTALLVLVIAILGIAGSLVALLVTHTPLNVGSYTGLIMITGIISENAIFTFLQFRTSIQEGKSKDEAIIYSISTRLRPKLMTALGAIIALLPIALGIGAGAQLHQPLAIAVIGGFIVALPLLLIVLPSLIRMTNISVPLQKT